MGEIISDELKRLTGVDMISQSLAYLMRSGPPDSYSAGPPEGNDGRGGLFGPAFSPDADRMIRSGSGVY